MDTPDIPDTETSKKVKDSQNSLGMSKHVYGMGVSANDGLLWGIGSTAAIFVAIAIGKVANWTALEKALTFLHEKPKEWLKIARDYIFDFFKSNTSHIKEGKFTKFFQKIGESLSNPAAWGLSVVGGSLISHAVLAPGYARGRKQANAIIKTHDEVLAERNQLQTENEQLKLQLLGQNNLPEDASQKTFASTLTPPAGSHAENVIAQAANADAGPQL